MVSDVVRTYESGSGYCRFYAYKPGIRHIKDKQRRVCEESVDIFDGYRHIGGADANMCSVEARRGE